MVTKYDIFQLVYKKRRPLRATDVTKELGRKTKGLYNYVHVCLQELEKEGYLVKSKHGFEGKVGDKPERLYRLIRHCMHNNINYNILLDKEVVAFIAHTLSKGKIGLKDSGLDSRKFRNYINTLQHYGLLLLISGKPIQIQIFYNSLIKNLLLHFKIKPALRRGKIDYINLINKELTKFRSLLRQDPQRLIRLVDELNIAFVHHSLSLEGNPITLPDTFKIIKQNIVPENTRVEHVNEVINYQKALMEMITNVRENAPLTVTAILRYHRLALAHRSDVAGIIRDGGVYIKGNPNFKIAKVKEINPKLEKLMRKYELFLDIPNKPLPKVLEFAAYFHNEFQHIHPFWDGNSRTTRLLLFHILQSNGLPVFDLPYGLLDEYMNNTKRYKQRSDNALYQLIQELVLFNLKLVNSKL